MGNKFDEMERSKAAPTGDGYHDDRHQDDVSANHRLSSLRKEIESSRHANESGVGCAIAGDGLSVSVNHQAVGLWKVEGSDLALYRPGSPSAECHVSTVTYAAKMTVRLVAATG